MGKEIRNHSPQLSFSVVWEKFMYENLMADTSFKNCTFINDSQNKTFNS